MIVNYTLLCIFRKPVYVLTISILNQKPFNDIIFLFFRYGRVEVLSGFVNALFLVVISFYVFTEALTRLFDPPKIVTDKLLVRIYSFLSNFFISKPRFSKIDFSLSLCL